MKESKSHRLNKASSAAATSAGKSKKNASTQAGTSGPIQHVKNSSVSVSLNRAVPAVAQKMKIDSLNQSSGQVAQREKLESINVASYSKSLQKKDDSVQRMEEDELQGKFDTAQLTEEELLQGKFDATQLMEEDELQGKFETAQLKSADSEKKANNTGLPDNLKVGVESLSGHSMDDVKVHRNSDKPEQLNAHAYAQGTDIHLGPGQEKHLPHEAWHVAQQAQGRVKPTTQTKGANVNDDESLEKEADVMGAKALREKSAESTKGA